MTTENTIKEILIDYFETKEKLKKTLFKENPNIEYIDLDISEVARKSFRVV